MEAGWAPGLVWTGAENLAPKPGFDLRTVQPVASPYTYCAIQAHTSGSRSPHCRGITITLRHYTLGRTPVDE
jgi:hypothetical protein